MNSTNPTVDNDLQKAIDDITKNTNQDPVFADPVAAPSSIPEGDTGKLAAPVGPFPAPAPAPAPKPIMKPAPKPAAPAPIPSMPAPEPIAAPAPEPLSTPAPAPLGQDMKSVKEAALRDLAPIMSKLDMDPSKKFNLYRNIREELHDNSVIAPAYEAAKDIANDRERADALLYLIDSIDNM